MVKINGDVNFIASVLCMGLFLIALISPVIIAAVFGTRARLKEAKIIQQNIDKGVYKKWTNTKSRQIRILILSQIVLLLSFCAWIGTGLLDSSKIFSPFRLVLLVMIFIIMFILGFVINRKIVKAELPPDTSTYDT